jgi:chromosome segregation ATPase
MLSSYDSLEQSNTMAVDSINQQREKINSLLSKVSQLDKKSKKDWRSIYKLQKEAETLRGIMKGYIHTIDSLNTLNINLSNSLTEKTKTLTKVSSQNKQFKEQNKELQQKVALGAVLQAGNIMVNPIRLRNSGAQSETTRASKTDMIKVCYSIVENKLAKAGDKTIYLRVLTKAGELLKAETALELVNFKNETIEMSSKRTINYQNQNTDMCIYYDLQKEIIPGNYIIELYNEGYLIGESSFSLR